LELFFDEIQVLDKMGDLKNSVYTTYTLALESTNRWDIASSPEKPKTVCELIGTVSDSEGYVKVAFA